MLERRIDAGGCVVKTGALQETAIAHRALLALAGIVVIVFGKQLFGI